MLEELGGTHVDGLGQVTPQHMGLYRAEVSGGSLTKASEQRDLAHTELVNRRHVQNSAHRHKLDA